MSLSRGDTSGSYDGDVGEITWARREESVMMCSRVKDESGVCYWRATAHGVAVRHDGGTELDQLPLWEPRTSQELCRISNFRIIHPKCKGWTFLFQPLSPISLKQEGSSNLEKCDKAVGQDREGLEPTRAKDGKRFNSVTLHLITYLAENSSI